MSEDTLYLDPPHETPLRRGVTGSVVLYEKQIELKLTIWFLNVTSR